MSEVRDIDALRAIYPPPVQRSLDKEVDRLDAHCRALIAHSPFFVLATSAADGTCDASPKGGPPGFVTVEDDRTLLWPDYTGNRRADSHRNILENPQAGLLFLVPGMGETLRVNGEAALVDDPEVLAAHGQHGKTPKLAIRLRVTVAYLHCAKALRRSELWEPSTWPDLGDVPTAAEILRDHVDNGRSLDEVQAELDQSYTERAW